MGMFQSVLGLFALVLLCWLVSENRKAARLRPVITGLGLQFAVALVLFKLPACRQAFLWLNRAVAAVEEATRSGTSFVFGYLGGGPLPFTESYPGSAFVLAFQAIPLVLVVSALSSLLFYWRVLPLVVRGFSWVLEKSMRIGGALGLSVAANVFVGMVEAPLIIKPYLGRMTRSELFTCMTSGMATIAGTVFILYAGILRQTIPDALGHLLAASVISAPAAILVSQLMIPETEDISLGRVDPPRTAMSSMDAVAQGTADGIGLYLNILAMLVVLIALVALGNSLLGLLPDVGGAPLSLQRLAGWILAPLAWLLGVPWAEAHTAGTLLGVKVVLNELLAFVDLAALPPGALSERSRLILTYAMCGFANFGSLGIMIGGMRALVPERAREVAELGPRTILSGFLASCMTGAVVGVIL
ncbi:MULTISPECIES: nucleoside transporter C-terminal domain-containing protein [Desulfovibrio]|jgi:CNT family concentrative nucleoside transporter|uniref:NupC/NupG family nucleoside CNT transporter n=1 Tax=Desulfovibrio TaxID=872 RepID=UPI0004133FF7|nr:nucleoside transporter C-terminal domain-containing protein [Desulfovibrio sp.]MDY0305933.1 nucleoside transporter C-terminal domain-containing protein [Desulfovibrionaceae bacterium]